MGEGQGSSSHTEYSNLCLVPIVSGSILNTIIQLRVRDRERCVFGCEFPVCIPLWITFHTLYVHTVGRACGIFMVWITHCLRMECQQFRKRVTLRLRGERH